MHPTVLRLGFHGRNAELADSFLRAVAHRGGSVADGCKILKWYADKFGPNSRITFDEIAPIFQYAADYRQWSPEIVQAVAGWFDAVDAKEGNPDAIAPVRSFSSRTTHQRLAEIRLLRQKRPDLYEADAQLQAEELALLSELEKNQSLPSASLNLGGGNGGAGRASVSGPVATQPGGGAAALTYQGDSE